MTPFHFGPSSAPLFGAYHPAAAGQSQAGAVVLCGPIGHEAMRAHPALRSLANQLAQAGHAVLRFDYWGTGDSDGAGMDVSLARWDESVRVAANELRDMCDARQVSLVGLRFGAVLALRYAARATVRHVLMWDPVINGSAYLDELRALHNARLAARPGTPVTDVPATALSDEIAGGLYPPVLREAIEGVDCCATRSAGRIAMVCTEERRCYREFEAVNPESTRCHLVPDAGQWGVTARWGDPLRVQAVPAQIVACLSGAAT